MLLFVQQSFFEQTLALDAESSPRHGFEPFGTDRLFAVDAGSKGFVFDAVERFADELKDVPVSRTLAEIKFFGIRLDGHVRNVLSILIFLAAVALGSLNHLRQRELLLQQLFLKIVQPFPFHAASSFQLI